MPRACSATVLACAIGVGEEIGAGEEPGAGEEIGVAIGESRGVAAVLLLRCRGSVVVDGRPGRVVRADSTGDRRAPRRTRVPPNPGQPLARMSSFGL